MAKKKCKNIFDAIKANDIEAVKTFLPEQLELRDKDGRTPLCLSCKLGRTEIVRLLLDNNANIIVHDNEGWSPLHQAMWYNSNYKEIVPLLLDNGANIDAMDNQGRTPLHWLCFFSKIKASEYLVRYGANPYVLNNNGKSALDCDEEVIMDDMDREIPHKEILASLRVEYLNRPELKKSETTAALSSGWEMEI